MKNKMSSENITNLQNEIKNINNRIEENFKLAKTWDINLAYQTFLIINSVDTDKQAEVLQFVAEKWMRVKQIQQLPVPEIVTRNEYKKYEKIYGEMINSILQTYLMLGIENNWGKQIFYSALWKEISQNMICDDEKKKTFFLYYVLIDERIPYYQLEKGIKLNRISIMNSIETLQKSEYMEKFQLIDLMEWETPVEKASCLMKLFSSLKNEAEKIVFMAMILDEFENRIDAIEG